MLMIMIDVDDIDDVRYVVIILVIELSIDNNSDTR
jgi:hypothetical protein